MSYYYAKTTGLSQDEALERVGEELKKEGFGVLTEIDVKATLKKKMNVDFPPYAILGACNPAFAYEALKNEAMIGVMLPCNVIVRENEDGMTVVAAVDPAASMQAVNNPALAGIAGQVREKLQRVIDAV